MACNINRNNTGKIISVEAPNGKESLLFQSINECAFMSDTETSLSVYMNAYAPKVESMDIERDVNGEPKLFYRTPKNNVTDNIEDPLIAGEIGQYSGGFYNAQTGEFTEVMRFNTQSSETSKFIAQKIQTGEMSAQRVLGRDGVNRFQGKGEFVQTRVFNAIDLSNQFQSELATPKVTVTEKGEIEVDTSNNFRTVEFSNGTTEVIPTELIPQYLEMEEVTNKAELIIDNLKVQLDGAVKSTEDPGKIKKSLLRFLQDMGFTVDTIKSYSERFNTKHGQDPDIRALVDISNRVVAFVNGEITMDSLTEEVAHIAIELFSDQNSINEALVNIPLTPEYREYADYYREKYAQRYKGAELEEMVRREVLGKILKKQFETNFQTPSEVQGFLRGLWERVTRYLKDRIKPTHTRQLEKLNQRIADSVLEMKSEMFDDSFGDGRIFYNAMSKEYQDVHSELLRQKNNIDRLFKEALTETVPSKSEMENIIHLNNETDIVASALTVIGVADGVAKRLKRDADRVKGTGQTMSPRNQAAFTVLKNNIVPSMNTVRNILERELENMTDPGQKKRVNQLIDSAREVNDLVNVIEPEINRGKEKLVDNIVETTIGDMNVSEEVKDEVRQRVREGNDISTLAKFFGIPSQSKNPLIQLLYKSAVRIESNTRYRFNQKYNTIVRKVVDEGLMSRQKDIIKRDSEGKATNHYISPYDLAGQEAEITNFENERLSQVTGKEIDEIKKLRAQSKPAEIIFQALGESQQTQITIQEYFNDLADFKSQTRERPRSDEYYEKGEQRFKDAGVSDNTVRYLRTKNIEKNRRDEQFRDDKGRVDNSLKTEADLELDQQDRKKYQENRSPRHVDGELKEGLTVISFEELTQEQRDSMPKELLLKLDKLENVGDVTILNGEIQLEDLPAQSRLALDLQNLSLLYRTEFQNQEKGTAVDEFNQRVNNPAGAYDFVMSNSTVHLSEEYYEGMGQRDNFFTIAEKHINSLTGLEQRDGLAVLARLRDLQRARRDLLKQNRKSNSALETDFNSMSKSTRDILIDLDSQIEEAKADLRLPKDVYQEISELDFRGEADLTEDFWKKKREFNGDSGSVYDFAIGHMTARNRNRTEAFAREVEDLMKKRRFSVYSEFQRFLDQNKKELEGLNILEKIEKAKDLYAQTRVASYFKRYQPEGYSELMDAMKSGKLSMRDALDKPQSALNAYPALRYLEITPDYGWLNDVSSEADFNPNYKKGGPKNQTKKLDPEFFEFFGITEEEFRQTETGALSEMTPRQNKDAYELLKQVTEINAEVNELYGTPDRSVYERPQISTSTFEKVFNPQGVKEAAKDFFTDIIKSKIDEKEYGEELGDTGEVIKNIPRYFQSRLESPELITQNVMEAQMLYLKEAIRYQERVNAQAEMQALEYSISQQRLKSRTGVKSKSRITGRGQVSNTHEKAQEMVDYYLYGVKQSRRIVRNVLGLEVDFTQIFSKLTRYNQIVNLALSPITDATSLTTGLYNNGIEALVGEYYDKSAGRWAASKLPAMLAKYVQESGKLVKDSELNHLLEFVGIEDAENKINESLQGRGMRMLNKSYFAMSKMANLPVTPMNMLAIMKDYKWYAPQGQFISYNDFLRIQREQNKAATGTAVRQMWSGLNDSFYDNLEITQEGVKMNQSFKDKFPENSEEAFEQVRVKLTAKIKQINQNVDSLLSQEDQVRAKRDVAMNAFLMHRSFFIINMTRRFKEKSLNLSTGQVEEGHYRKVLHTMRKLTKHGMKALDIDNGIVEEQEVRNLKRFGIEMGAAIIFAGILHAVDLGDEDEEGNYFAKAAELIGLRTFNETISSQIVGIPGTGYEMYENPIIQFNTFKNTYKAITKPEDFWKYMGKNFLVGRRYQQLDDMNEQVSAYRHFNDKTLMFYGLGEN